MGKRFALCGVIALLLIAGISRAQDGHVPRHLAAAKKLLQQIELRHTSYEHGAPRIVWTGTCESHADCSGFVDELLTHSYGYDADAYKRWFDSHRPSARRYHDAIVEQKGFREIPSIADLRPGDLLAVKYLEKKENTGHIMLAATPAVRMKPARPLIEGTEQWEVKVIDSSRSGHGPTDTRHAKGKQGKDHDGLGQGILRIYSTHQGTVAGFTWSTLASSEFKSPQAEHLVIGRLKAGFVP